MAFITSKGPPGHRTLDSPLQIDGFEKVKVRKLPEIGGDTAAELKAVGHSEETIRKMAEVGAIHIAK